MNDQKEFSLVFLVLGLIMLLFSRLLARVIMGVGRATGAKGGNVRHLEIAYIIGGLLGIVIGGIGLLKYYL